MAPAPPQFDTVVMKFGGSSVADADKIKNVARRLVEAKERGLRVVGTVSAMGKTTDGLLSLAGQISPTPEPREPVAGQGADAGVTASRCDRLPLWLRRMMPACSD